MSKKLIVSFLVITFFNQNLSAQDVQNMNKNELREYLNLKSKVNDSLKSRFSNLENYNFNFKDTFLLMSRKVDSLKKINKKLDFINKTELIGKNDLIG